MNTPKRSAGLSIRRYGDAGPCVLVLHGGPAAPGQMAPVARRLADSFRVLEPWQRGSGDEPLTVARHVTDLHEVMQSLRADPLPALVGFSWGAMLALAYAAAHPDTTGPIVLIGCGTFDPPSREKLKATMDERMNADLRNRLTRLDMEIPDPDKRLAAAAALLLPLYSHELVSTEFHIDGCDARAHEETWADMLRLQEQGLYPAAFAAIRGPVLMLHGAADPHPGRMIRAGLQPYVPQLEYHEWEQCGHYPWLEKHVHENFFAALREWLFRTLR